MESSLGVFYLEIAYKTFQAVVMITDSGGGSHWKLIQCAPDNEWPQKATWRKGTWKLDGQKTRCYALGTGVDAQPGSANQTMLEVFRLIDIEFPPDISSNQRFWNKMFFIGDHWAGEKHIRTGLHVDPNVPAGKPGHLTVDTHGNWTPFVTGPLVNAIKLKLQAMHDELVQLCIQLGLDIVALADWTGAFSIPASAYALRNGDYLGCCLNLLGVIPLFGKASNAAKVAAISARLEYLTKEVTFIQRWLETSIDFSRRLRHTQQLEGRLNLAIQGTTKGRRVAKGAEETADLLKNSSWIQKIGTTVGGKVKSAAELGFLPEELDALRKLARDGYYFVVRSCPKIRVDWLKAARQRGWGIIAKPVWLKIKSLKGVKFEGLVGFLKTDIAYYKTVENFERVVSAKLPAGFKLDWLAFKGMSMSNVKVYRVSKEFNIPKVEDAHMMLDHYWVDTGDAFILVDKFGKPYLSDIDIAIIQKIGKGGKFGAPEEVAGPARPVTKFLTSDDAQFTHFWNTQFGNIHYPTGYKPFGWHGGRGGSAAFKQADGTLGWYPEKPTEDLVVAVKGVEGLGDDVGFVTGWDQLGNFQRANPSLGKYLFDPPK